MAAGTQRCPCFGSGLLEGRLAHPQPWSGSRKILEENHGKKYGKSIRKP